MAQIIPAILTRDGRELQDKLNQLADLVEWAQIDLMDGEFTKNISVTPEEISRIKTDINLEAHLMVTNPAGWLDYLKDKIFRRVYFHIEAVSEPNSLIKLIRRQDFEVGIAVNLETPLAALAEYIKYIDAVLFMAVTPGWQRQKFDAAVLEKIKECAREYSNIDIAVDGGINVNNIRAVSEAGAVNICVGSAIFLDNNPADNIQTLKDHLL